MKERVPVGVLVDVLSICLVGGEVSLNEGVVKRVVVEGFVLVFL